MYNDHVLQTTDCNLSAKKQPIPPDVFHDSASHEASVLGREIPRDDYLSAEDPSCGEVGPKDGRSDDC